MVSTILSKYYLSEPYSSSKISYFRGICIIPNPKQICPFYAPVVPDAPCRFCMNDVYTHRRYWLYSHYARIIQKKVMLFLYRKLKRRYIAALDTQYLNYPIWIRHKFFYLRKYKKMRYLSK